MIHDFGASGDVLAAEQTWDLCIVGAGAAGLALASEFLGTPWRVIVLESGLREPDARGDDLNSLDSVGLRHDGWREGRVRCLGGTTRAWGGQLVPMRASELQPRPWIPDSGWPLTLEELEPYYRRVESLLRIEGPPYDGTAWPLLRIAPPALDPDKFSVRFSQWAALGRRNFAVLWRRELERSANVSVLLDATTVAVQCVTGGAHCEAMSIRSRSGREALVRARWYVVACGGIETARLLLASPTSGAGEVASKGVAEGNGQVVRGQGASGQRAGGQGVGGPAAGGQGAGGQDVGCRGVANSSGLVGRFFQDHVSYVAGEVEPASRRVVQNLFDPRYVGSTMYSVKVEPSDAAMRREGWLNAMAHIAFQIPDALGWMELRRILRSLQAGRLELPSRDEAIAMLRGSAELTRLVLTRYFANRRRSPDAGKIRLLIDSEQAPSDDSRVSLDTQVDALGMPRARLDWRITDLERRTLTGFAQSVATEFERLGLGKIKLAGAPDFDSRDQPGAARDIFHHMGTTRMSATARSGVTRPDLRCHDVDNLFVAGAAVFPTGGIANPTFTALALSLRLADHLKSTRNPI